MPELDLTDPLIRDMVNANHRPREQWIDTGLPGRGDTQLNAVRCRMCQKEWPCPTRMQLDQWNRNDRKGPQ